MFNQKKIEELENEWYQYKSFLTANHHAKYNLLTAEKRVFLNPTEHNLSIVKFLKRR
jgi:hypothetical protein